MNAGECRSKVRLALLTLLASGCAFSASTCADATVAKGPHSTRQTYPDGTFTEMACHRDRSRLDSQSCLFTTVDRKGKAEYKFSIDSLGYHDDIEVYGFFPLPKRDFQIKFVVRCIEEDLALHPAANEMNSTCHLTMGPRAEELVPLFLELDGEAGGSAFFRTRTFQGSARS